MNYNSDNSDSSDGFDNFVKLSKLLQCNSFHPRKPSWTKAKRGTIRHALLFPLAE